MINSKWLKKIFISFILIIILGSFVLVIYLIVSNSKTSLPPKKITSPDSTQIKTKNQDNSLLKPPVIKTAITPEPIEDNLNLIELTPWKDIDELLRKILIMFQKNDWKESITLTYPDHNVWKDYLQELDSKPEFSIHRQTFEKNFINFLGKYFFSEDLKVVFRYYDDSHKIMLKILLKNRPDLKPFIYYLNIQNSS